MNKIALYFLLLFVSSGFVAVIFNFPEPLQTYLEVVTAVAITIVFILLQKKSQQ
ncbi:MAG TPA: hypothetical protein VNG53_08265 [Bacteroidia bacterium]|nr:hypothetical protein [Bacteroidia bacterium]